MNDYINYYPTLDNEIKESIEFESNFVFSFISNETKNQLSSTVSNDKYVTIGDDNEWDSNIYDLQVSIEININKPNLLFGINGIAPVSSKIGVAVEWYSQKSKIRSVSKSQDLIVNTNQPFVSSIKTFVPKNTVDGEITFTVLLFLEKEALEINSDEEFLNNKAGVLLGVLDEKYVYLSGYGSLFPIFNSPSPSKSLWNIIIEECDPYVDKLSDCVRIIINSSHKNYYLLDPHSKNYCEALIFEIVSSAISILFSTLKERGDLDDINIRQNADGSIIQFIQYLINKNISIDNVLSTSSSIREYLCSGGKQNEL